MNQDKRAEIEFTAGEIRAEGDYSDRLDPRRRERQLGLLGIVTVQKQLILDAGCGPGTYGLVLACQGNNVVGVDISTDMVRVAKGHAIKERLNYFTLVGDLERLPLRDESFDIVFGGSILHHFPDMEKAARELYRTLKSGGTIALIEPNGSNPVVRMGRVISMMLAPLIRSTAYATSPNERKMHPYRAYVNALQKMGAQNIKVSSHLVTSMASGSTGGLANRMLSLAWGLRMLLCRLTTLVLPQPYGGLDLYITATKADPFQECL